MSQSADERRRSSARTWTGDAPGSPVATSRGFDPRGPCLQAKDRSRSAGCPYEVGPRSFHQGSQGLSPLGWVHATWA